MYGNMVLKLSKGVENLFNKVAEVHLSNPFSAFKLESIGVFDCIIVENIAQEDFGRVCSPKARPYTKLEYAFKRFIDYLIGSILLILTSPVILYSIYRIKRESPDGPILFKQTRIGKDGVPFECYKFRSMRTDIHYFNEYTQENDPRIFPWGEIMRKTRIDELPQLINVFKGEMHLIGPRAEWNRLVEKYEIIWPYYHERHKVAPGITGWAQVNYPYGKSIKDTYEKLMYDLYYIKNWSLWLEIKTIFKTITTMVGMRGV
jgi:lipopolysaccharide/colanic/teichoic acid biosynthesis glycosyltransferase